MSSPTLDTNDALYYEELSDGERDRTGTVTYLQKGDETHVVWTESADGAEFDVLRFARDTNLLRIFPHSISSGKLQPSFAQVKELQLEQSNWDPDSRGDVSDRFGLLQVNGLPKGFTRVFAFGIGIKRDFRGFVHLIEAETACSIVRFVHSGEEGVSHDGKVFTATYGLFRTYCDVVKRNRDRGYQAVARVKLAQTHNVLADVLGVARKEVKYGRNPVINAMTEEIEHGYVTTSSDRDLLVTAISQQARKVADESPLALVKLRSDIELVSLDSLIDKFESNLSGPFKSDEKHWQAFFEENAFALKQLFAMPLAIVQREAEVKAGDLSGTGRRIADFLCANPVTRVAMIVEIKTPAANLMYGGKGYRGAGSAEVFAIHKDLSGALAQLQGQMVSTQADLPARLGRGDDIDVWGDLRGAIIAGKFDDLSEGQKASFLRYRAGLANVTILTYDEVLIRLKDLRDALNPPETGSSKKS